MRIGTVTTVMAMLVIVLVLTVVAGHVYSVSRPPDIVCGCVFGP